MHLDRISADPPQVGGLPCIRGLRVRVVMILGQMAAVQIRAGAVMIG